MNYAYYILKRLQHRQAYKLNKIQAEGILITKEHVTIYFTYHNNLLQINKNARLYFWIL